LILQQTKQVLDAVYHDNRFVSMEIVEYNPELSPEYAIECDKVIKYLLNFNNFIEKL
jgi:arginase family enzyme